MIGQTAFPNPSYIASATTEVVKMAGRKRSSNSRQSGPSGALVIWLACLVFGIGVAVVLVYRSALVSHTGDVTAAEAAAKMEAKRLQVSVGANDDMRAAQAALLQAPAASTTAPVSTPKSGPEASPAK